MKRGAKKVRDVLIGYSTEKHEKTVLSKKAQKNTPTDPWVQPTNPSPSCLLLKRIRMFSANSPRLCPIERNSGNLSWISREVTSCLTLVLFEGTRTLPSFGPTQKNPISQVSSLLPCPLFFSLLALHSFLLKSSAKGTQTT